MRNDLTVDARANYLIYKDYGKINELSTVTLNTNNNVIEADFAGKDVLYMDDAIYVYPYLASTEDLVDSNCSGLTIHLKIRYPKFGIGTVLENFSYTMSSNATSLVLAVEEINDELTRQGYFDILQFRIELDRVYAQTKKIMTSFGFVKSSTIDFKFEDSGRDTIFSHQLIFKVANQTNQIEELYFTDPGLINKFLTDSELINLFLTDLESSGREKVELIPIHETVKRAEYNLNTMNYITLKPMGESESSNLIADQTSVEHSGSSLSRKQIEYVEGNISYEISAQEFNFENLVDIKNWKKVDGVVTPYGKTSVDSYSLYGNRVPNVVEIISFSHDLSDVLHTMHIKKGRSEGFALKILKNEFRVYDEKIRPITPDDSITINMSYQR